MMHAHSVRSHKLRRIKTSTTYAVAYIRSLIYNVTSQATCFAVSVPAQEFNFSPTPQLYMQNVNLSSRLQLNTSIYVYPYIYFYIKAIR